MSYLRYVTFFFVIAWGNNIYTSPLNPSDGLHVYPNAYIKPTDRVVKHHLPHINPTQRFVYNCQLGNNQNFASIFIWLRELNFKFKAINEPWRFLRLLLLISGQVEPNPGPYTPKYPCQICKKAVKWGQRGLACDNCDLWYHVSCMTMTSGEYDILANKSAVWACINCQSMNHSTVYSSLSATLESITFSGLSSISGEPSLTSPASASDFSFHSPIAKSTPTKPSNSTSNPKKKSISSLRAIVINFQSIKNKAAEVQVLIDNADPDVIIGTETWLHDGVSSSEVIPRNYSTYRNDRKTSCHGGVLVAAKTDIASSLAYCSPTSELVSVKIETSEHQSLIVSSYYRPPDNNNVENASEFINEISTLQAKYPRSQFWLGGDFNLPDIEWIDLTVRGNQYPREMNHRYLDLIHLCTLDQMVRTPTRRDNILDLFLTSNPTLVSRCKTIPGVGDHDAVLLDSKTTACRVKPPRRKIYLWDKANIPALHQDAANFVVGFLSQDFHDIREMWETFHRGLIDIQQKHVPHKQSRHIHTNPWMNTSLRRMIRRKDRAYRKAKATKRERDWTRYRSLKTETQRTVRQAHNKYVCNIISPDCHNNPKRFWSHVKSRRQEAVGVAPLRGSDGLVHIEPKAKSDILNDQFQSVFTRENTSSIPTPSGTPFPSMSDIHVRTQGVEKLLRRLSPHKASGPDSIPARLLKELAAELAPALRRIYQLSLDTSTIPEIWKQAHIVPIFKKGDRSRATNYRPVSLTAICSKLVEHIIHSEVMEHLDRYNILSDTQHGFRKRRSCETQLIQTIHELACGVDGGHQMDLVLLDFSKAFDKVPHERLLRKLDHYGIRNNIHGWFKDFLYNRKQHVIVEGSQSADADILSGVPQGTVVGPLLFLMYINDLPESISSNMRLFADDCIVYRSIKKPEDSLLLQKDLDNLQKWEDTWQMQFNPEKCVAMHISRKRRPCMSTYHLHGHILETVSSSKYLGVTISADLSWREHTNNISARASRSVGFLRRNLHACPKDVRAQAYTTLVRPTLEYAASAWDPYIRTQIDQLEGVQRRAARFVLGDYQSRDPGSMTAMLKNLGWDSLEQRRAVSRVLMIHNIIHHQVDSSINHLLRPSDSRTRRGNLNYQQIHVPARLDLFLHSFLPRTIRTWNLLPNSTKGIVEQSAFRSIITSLDLLATSNP